jgi:hypothetical protein
MIHDEETTEKIFHEAFNTRDIARFMELMFPPEWSALRARIIESGATMSKDLCDWAPRWSPVPPTVRGDADALEGRVRSCIYRMHDCLHNLWGLPIPGAEFSKADFYVYKRSQMCGEVAVLTLTEFAFCKSLLDRHPSLRDILWSRDALAMLDGPMRGRSLVQVAARLDGMLHKWAHPQWVREHAASLSFAAYYVPMLEHDRRAIDHNWELMKAAQWRPVGAPNARYSTDTDGLELTTWMIDDFQHLMDTDHVVDEELAAFNRGRRAGIVLPKGWNEPDAVLIPDP